MALPAQAQESMLTKAKTYLDASQGLQIEYQLKVGNDTSLGSYNALGTAFYLESDAMKAWHEGGKLWVYVAQNGEINLSTPEREDLLELNPLLNLERVSSRTFTLKESKAGEVTNIQATPKSKKGEEIEWLILSLDKNGKPLMLKVKQKGIAQAIEVKVTKITKGCTDAMKRKGYFSFASNKLPGVSVIDLR